MKIIQLSFILFLAFATIAGNAQTATKELKAGHQFYISVQDYMSKTIGLNSSAAIQFKNVVKDVAGFVIEDSKEEMKLAETSFSSMNEYYEYFVKDFLKDEEKRTISTPVISKNGQTNYVEIDASYYDKESKIEIYYYICLVERNDYYYKVLCWTSLENKDKYKPDFQKIAYSLRD